MSRPLPVRCLLAASCFSLLPAFAGGVSQAQATTAGKPLTVADYSRWRNIEDAVISPDGKWVAYTLRYTNTLPADSRPVMYLRNLESSQELQVAHAHDPSFSRDSRWVVYQLDSVPASRGGRSTGEGAADSSTDQAAVTQDSGSGSPSRAVPPRVGLRELATGSTRTWQRVQSASFNYKSTHLLLQRRASVGAGRGGSAGGSAPAGGRGGATSTGGGHDAILVSLEDGRALFLGSLGEAAFNRQGDLLGYTVDAAEKMGNGLYVMDLEGSRTQVLDNDTLTYARLTWSDDGNAIAILKGHSVAKMRDRDNVLVAFTGVREGPAETEMTPVVLDPPKTPGFPMGFVVSERAPLSWSEDGRLIFLGILPQRAAPDTGRRPGTDSLANVDVWRTQDEEIQSVQMIRAEQERNFTFRQAFDIRDQRYVTLTDSAMRTVVISPDGKWAAGFDDRAYVSDYERPRADLYRVNTATGQRTLIVSGQLTGQYLTGFSPDGGHYLYWRDNRYQSYDLNAGTTTTLANAAGSFANMEFDYPGVRPPYGVAGFSSDGAGVIAQHRFDMWYLPFDGSVARNLTGGVGSQRGIRFRYIRTDAIDSTASRAERTGDMIDLSKPVTLSAFGEYTKKSGYFRIQDGALKELVFEDALYNTPIRAELSDRFLLTRQTFREFPDLRVSGPGFADARKISDANPQQAGFLWGRRVLFDYRIKDGTRLQGILALPDDYKPGEKRPMIVSFYEKNSQNMHRYAGPSFLTGMGSIPTEALSRGYITMLADVFFHTGSSHSDMLQAVEAATRKVIAMGYADPKRIGVHGHSYGGEGAAFIGTRSRLFAAIGMGAGVTDLFTDFSQSWGWSYQVSGGSGANGNEYYLNGQGRWGKSPWDDPELYRFESALAHAPEATAPFLIMHGTADPTVSFSEGMNFYNALRYNGKSAVMLAYPNEGHGLRGLANRRDLTIRYFQFFDHYLKGAPAPKWMTEGVPYIVKATLKGDPK